MRVFPKGDWSVASRFYRKYSFYLKNLSVLLWATLGFVVIANTLSSLFYIVDGGILGHWSKYEFYWKHGKAKWPTLTFFGVVCVGYLLHSGVAVIGYRRYWRVNFEKELWSYFLPCWRSMPPPRLSVQKVTK
nr:hypothetical protein [Candidatus Mycoplasma haematolamae]